MHVKEGWVCIWSHDYVVSCGNGNQVQVLGSYGRPLGLEVMLDTGAWVINVMEESSSLALCQKKKRWGLIIF